MSIHKQKTFLALAVVLLAMGAAMPAAQADNDSGKYGGENSGKPLQPAQTNAKFQQECSTCHIAYAPGLLPAESWRKVMAGLDKHFGSDASLDAEDNKEITAFLVNNASNRWSSQSAPLRITESAWFKRKHDSREINPAIWKNPQVKSPANCGACHPRADRGNFDEHEIRMPR
ncbi:MAG: diheme cytochrome c [Gallionella sp.]|nr:diheme cytochrome c [Gallionella sp.]